MRNIRLLALAILLITVVIASYMTLRALGLIGSLGLAQVKAVPAGHQELALLAPATSSDTWERLVAAVHTLEKDWQDVYPKGPRLAARYDKAFLNLTADVPEVSLRVAGFDGTLLIRWYKLSSENSASEWIENLARRTPPPVALVGGDNSERAADIAKALDKCRGKWQGPAPLFLITTATADRVFPGPFIDPNPGDADGYPKLTEVYKGATFRFSFTNTLMAEAVLDFVQRQPQLWPLDSAAWLLFALTARAHPLAAVAPAVTTWKPTALFTAAWEDDPYSRDLEQRFTRVFHKRFMAQEPDGPAGDPRQPLIQRTAITYSVGDFMQPNLVEFLAVGNFLQGHRADVNQLLLLPTNAQRARRFLRDLYRRDPSKVKNLVVVSGDSIAINNIYRDGPIIWNYLDLPVPLVFFSHRNPVDEAAGFDEKTSKTGTQDLLLFRDILEAVLQAGCEKQKLLADAGRLSERLREIRWRKGRVYHADFFAGAADEVFPRPGDPLFDDEGNRRVGTGERIVYLKPDPSGPSARIFCWRRMLEADGRFSWLPGGKTLELRGGFQP